MKTEGHSTIKVIAAALLLCIALALSACEQDGPMENAGEEIDDAVEEVRDSAEEVGDSAEEAADEVEDEIDDVSSG